MAVISKTRENSQEREEALRDTHTHARAQLYFGFVVVLTDGRQVLLLLPTRAAVNDAFHISMNAGAPLPIVRKLGKLGYLSEPLPLLPYGSASLPNYPCDPMYIRGATAV